MQNETDTIERRKKEKEKTQFKLKLKNNSTKTTEDGACSGDGDGRRWWKTVLVAAMEMDVAGGGGRRCLWVAPWRIKQLKKPNKKTTQKTRSKSSKTRSV
jgi:hypothetical protein